MLSNDDIKNIPMEHWTTVNRTMVAIWCTNAPTLIRTVLNDFLPKWNLKLIATWFWVKVMAYMFCLMYQLGTGFFFYSSIYQ